MKKGVVIKSTGSRYRVLGPDNTVDECVITGRFREMDRLRTTNPVAVGDIVLYEEGDGETGLIREIEERKNYIIRKSSNLSKESQIIAANIDLALLIITLRDPSTPEEFIDRFLVAAESFRIPVLLIFNKTDLYGNTEFEKLDYLISVYESIGYGTLSLSLLKGEGTDTLSDKLKNRITLVAGNSGVGKSTLLNRLIPGADIRTGEISKYHRQGKHVTTFAEMYRLPDGGAIIDTPGIRGFAPAYLVKEEIYHFFPEIFALAGKCRYYNCLHVDEPECAVTEAVEKGEIAWTRYRSYLSLIGDANSKYRV
ncbi:MAG: ribosome small subunit-dependent GTPase A [Bacteroidales bacterium]|nr:ribosome small subunit-dependent GTPase A [Bacteroidales bacterium]